MEIKRPSSRAAIDTIVDRINLKNGKDVLRYDYAYGKIYVWCDTNECFIFYANSNVVDKQRLLNEFF